MADFSDLLGGNGVVPAGTTSEQAAAQGVEKSLRPDDQASDAEKTLVSRWLKEYTAARQFDKTARAQYAKDRRYAAGESDPNWASDANLIGSFIDILVSFLYAQNPDVGVRPAKQVEGDPDDTPITPTPSAPPIGLGAGLAPPVPGGPPPMGTPPPPEGAVGLLGAPAGSGLPPMPGAAPPVPPPPPAAPVRPDNTRFKMAATMELVISQLWKDGNLKKSGKKMVRSALSVGPGWFKGAMLSQKIPAPQLDKELTTQQDQLEAIQAAKKTLAGGESTEPEADELAIQERITGLNAKLAKKKRYGMMVDFVRAEDVTVSLDVADLADYKDAQWLANDIYVEKSKLSTRFPRLSADDVKASASYYQRIAPAHTEVMDTVLGDNAAEVGQFSKTEQNTGGGEGKQTEFAKVIEIWDRDAQLVRTIVDGVKMWAVEPYSPPQATKRFYSLFYLAFYPVDGKRHPQSLSWRLHKLQDEYSSCRSNERVTRERSLPGIIFNSEALDHDEAKKISDGVIGEYLGVKTTAETPLQNVFIAKPISTFNPALYNTEPILSDMQRVSGVQEALQGAEQGSDRQTATEVNEKKAGFQSRTGADRDVLEEVLDDFAEYTAECAIQECPLSWVQRVAGKNAFWLGPDDIAGTPGMDVEDLLNMVEVEIDAGTTGKPNAQADKAAWAQILPLLEKSLIQIRAMQMADPGLAEVLIQVLRETLKVLDYRLDIDEFIPQGTPTPAPPVPPPPPAVKINIDLQGQMPPEDTQALLSAEATTLPKPPGAPQTLPGGAPMPALPGGIPMPPLTVKPPPASKTAPKT
jgi:hypothetical protein